LHSALNRFFERADGAREVETGEFDAVLAEEGGVVDGSEGFWRRKGSAWWRNMK
jgi:hypothetical protein